MRGVRVYCDLTEALEGCGTVFDLRKVLKCTLTFRRGYSDLNMAIEGCGIVYQS